MNKSTVNVPIEDVLDPEYLLNTLNYNSITDDVTNQIMIQIPKDTLFIEEVIRGVAFRYGRKPNKYFLYDIVNNIYSGLDMDKLDYLQRDMILIKPLHSIITLDRFIDLALVLPATPIVNNNANTDNIDNMHNIEKSKSKSICKKTCKK